VTGKSRTVGLMTVGCKLNQYETEGVAERLEEYGFVVVPFDTPADVYVVNTCTVTGRSDYRSRQMLRRAARKCGEALVVATGCYAQRDPDALAAMPEVSLVVGNSSKRDLAGLVVECLRADAGDSSETRIEVRSLKDEAFEAFDISRFRGYTRAFIKIQDGCDQRCTYCAVPDARGPARSRHFDDVLEQASTLSANGYRELVLTGVHIGAFEDPDGRRLPELLRALAEIDGLVRLRLGSVEPRELTPELAETVLQTEKVCNHLHVPLESGSDAVLKRMRRGYTRARYAEAGRRVTDAEPLCGLGTDVMVGFPGETEENFADRHGVDDRISPVHLPPRVRLLAENRHAGGRDGRPGAPGGVEATQPASQGTGLQPVAPVQTRSGWEEPRYPGRGTWRRGTLTDGADRQLRQDQNRG